MDDSNSAKPGSAPSEDAPSTVPDSPQQPVGQDNSPNEEPFEDIASALEAWDRLLERSNKMERDMAIAIEEVEKNLNNLEQRNAATEEMNEQEHVSEVETTLERSKSQLALKETKMIYGTAKHELSNLLMKTRIRREFGRAMVRRLRGVGVIATASPATTTPVAAANVGRVSSKRKADDEDDGPDRKRRS
ncbi:hypothetical protein OQA88_2629 [Cercophora sp. LCS_1]